MSAAAAPAPERVRVFARQRPLGRGEEQDVAGVAADAGSGEVSVNVAAAEAVDRALSGALEAPGAREEPQAGPRRFRFDGAFDGGSSQDEVFQQVGLPVLKDVMRGFHGCVMAYGQTGSGKTHSLLNTGSPELAGLLPRLIATLFVRVGADQGHRHQVRVSAVQVYNEQISDLLHPDHAGGGGQGLNVQSSGSVQGTTWLPCRDPQAAMKAFAQARTNLVYAETKMNKASSRSHAVFQIEVARYASEEGNGKSAKATLGVLTVVDLAGSERVKRSGVVGKEMKEAININGSLLALGNVVQALAAQKKHVPFRDSKLTRLLEPALSGNCRTSLLVCVSPTLESAQETCHALEFASRAMRVEVCAKVNEVDVTSLCNELSQLVAVPLAESADKELRQKAKEISALEEKLTQSAQEARKWEERSSQESRRAKDLQDALRKEAEDLERRRQEAAEQGATALRKLREESDAELAKQRRQASELSAEAAGARKELQAAKAVADAALAARQKELGAARAEAAAAKGAAEKAAAEHGKALRELRESHERRVGDLEAGHGRREAELQGQVEELRRSIAGASAETASQEEARAAEVEGLRGEVRRVQAAAAEEAARHEAAAAGLREEQTRQAEELRAQRQAHAVELEAAIGRLSAANEASRAELESALAGARSELQASGAETRALRGEMREAQEASEAALRAGAARLEELRRGLQCAEDRAEAAGEQLASLREEAAREREEARRQAQLVQEQLADARQRLERSEAAREEERRLAGAESSRAEALAQRLQQELEAANRAASQLTCRCTAAEAALISEKAILEEAHAAKCAAAEATHREESAALAAVHKARTSELQAQHAERVAELTERHEVAETELRWRLSETEEAYRVLQKRFDGRESRPDDVSAIATQRRTIRELSTERKQLDLELQHQLQTDRVFSGGERKRVQAHLRNAVVGKKLTSSGSFNQRRDEMFEQVSQQRHSSLIEPIY